MRLLAFALAIFFVTILRAEPPRSAADGPLPPPDSMKRMDLTPGWTIELVAAEPDVASPVAMTWDECGRLFVAEMRDYPNNTGGGTIRMLEETTGDGRVDKSTIFAEGLKYPNGLLPWNGGILVTSAPDILFLRDTDGDGKADVRKVILTGFGEGNQQLRVNGLAWGIDGWIYAANGRSGGQVTSPKRPGQAPLNIDRHDLRFKPDTGEVELAAGFSQFGNVIDEWGNRFINWNTVPFRHVVFPYDVAASRPNFTLPTDCEVLEDPIAGNRVFPKSSKPATFNREPAGYFNASCGLAVDKSGLFPEADAHCLYVCEPLFNIVHRRKLKYKGVTFEAVRPDAEKDREFLSSTDPWFRPVYCTFGPDGCLYVADFYRQWVEHPDFVRPELRGDVTWNTGKDFGRIYRLYPKGMTPAAVTDLSKASTDDLISNLGEKSVWKRETARRLLVERRDPELADRLRSMFDAPVSPIACVNAMIILAQLGPIDDGCWRWLREMSDPNILEFSLRVARSRSERPAGIAVILDRVMRSDNHRLQFEAMLTASALDSNEREELVRRALEIPKTDTWIDQATLCATSDDPVKHLRHHTELFVAKLRAIDELRPATKEPIEERSTLQQRLGIDVERLCHLFEQMSEIAGAHEVPSEETDFHDAILNLKQLDPSLAQAAATGFFTGLANAKRPLPKSLANQRTEDWFVDARQQVSESEESSVARIRSIRLLSHDVSSESTTLFASLLGGETSPDIQRAALVALRGRPDPAVAEAILDQWPSATPSMKREMTDVLFARRDRLDQLIAAMEEGIIAPGELDPDRQRQLREQASEAMKAKVEALLKSQASADRSAVIKTVQETWPKEGNADSGARLFTKHCAGCHRVGDVGTKVGPDIAGLINKSREQVLEEILDPNRQVLPDYISFQVMTDDGVSVSGLLAEESSGSISLRRAEGALETIPRAKIEELRATGRSLMPEGFEQSITPSDFADIVAFLRGTP